jgi:hypothetical protein
MPELCQYPETLCEAEFKTDRLINMVKEISGKHSF